MDPPSHTPIHPALSLPPSVLLLATIIYAALCTSPDRLWELDPSIGTTLCTGFPHFSLPTMQRVSWVARACHFVANTRPASGVSGFWVPTAQITQHARNEALRRTLSVLSCVRYAVPEASIDESLWTLTSRGLVRPVQTIHPKPLITLLSPPPSAHDFLLFAAIDYHFFRSWEINVLSRGKVVFSTNRLPPQAVVDVSSEEEALAVVIAHMVGRPHSQSVLRAMAVHHGEDEVGPSEIDLDSVLARDMVVCKIDFHSYASESTKVSATLHELAGAYYRVVQFIKQSSYALDNAKSGKMAHIDVGQTLWIAIFGGAVFSTGRLTIQNLPGRWGGVKNLKDTTTTTSPDEAYLTRLDAVLNLIAPHANKPTFGDIVISGGVNRLSTYPFLFLGLCGQALVCTLLSACTPAGVWTSVALANTLYAGKLTDLHSVQFGKMQGSEEPGMKMYRPSESKSVSTRGRDECIAVATLDRTPPREGRLRPGVLANLVGVVAALFGVVFRERTRVALGLGPAREGTPSWVLHTTVLLAISTSVLVAVMLIIQQGSEKTWRKNSQLPTRWMVYSTLPVSLLVAGLATYSEIPGLGLMLDAVTFVSGFPLGMLENGRMFSADDNVLHLVLLNRWVMGAIASAVSS